MDQVIYLDNNATTRVAPEVFEAMRPFFCERYGNPSSIYRFGGEVAAEITRARNSLAELLGVEFRDRDGVGSEIIFNSCGTEGANTALNAALVARPDRRKIVVSAVEHPAVLAWAKEQVRRGYSLELIPVDKDGRIALDDVKERVDAETAVVSVMWANNEIGNVFPIEEIAGIAHAAGALCHSDAVQAVGKVPIRLADSQLDFLSLSGHKLHAPKGVGALYVRRGIRFRPFLLGGHQERGRRGGTENVASIVGLGKACELAKENLETEAVALAQLRDALENGVRERIPRVRLNGDRENRLPNTASISFEYIEGEAILLLLDQYGICASSGSACTTGSLEPSHVLRAMDLPYTAAHGTVRFSLSKYNTRAEIDRVLDVLPGIVETLRRMSPFWTEGKG